MPVPSDPIDIPFPETPRLAQAEIVGGRDGGRSCLLATAEDGHRVAFGFEVEGDRPGLVLVDLARWLEAADASEDDPAVFDAVDEPNADDWLQAVITHPVGAQWLRAIESEHPDAYHSWFAQTDYDEGGEEGSGGAV